MAESSTLPAHPKPTSDSHPRSSSPFSSSSPLQICAFAWQPSRAGGAGPPLPPDLPVREWQEAGHPLRRQRVPALHGHGVQPQDPAVRALQQPEQRQLLQHLQSGAGRVSTPPSTAAPRAAPPWGPSPCGGGFLDPCCPVDGAGPPCLQPGRGKVKDKTRLGLGRGVRVRTGVRVGVVSSSSRQAAPQACTPWGRGDVSPQGRGA